MIITDSRSSGYRLSMQPTDLSAASSNAVSGSFTVVSLNIHKGLSPLNRRVIVHDIRHALHALSPELVFLQEVQDAHVRHAARFADWPVEAQSRYLAGALWPEVHYGRNEIGRASCRERV